MIYASAEFQRIILNERRNFDYDILIKFADGTSKTIDNTMLTIDNNSITVSAGSSTLPLGNAVAKILRLTLTNLHDEWSEYNFLGAVINVSLSMPLADGTVERIFLGSFTVVEPESYGTTVGINALDDLWKADKKFDAEKIVFPASAQNVFIEACRQAGLEYVSSEFPNNDYMMVAPEQEITCRGVLGQCALLAGGNALADMNGRVFIREYQFGDQTIFDGGVFDNDTPYSTGDDLDGGTFAYNDGDTIDGGRFTDLSKFHIFSNTYNTTIFTDDVVVTKVKVVKDEEVYEYGTSDAYVINIAKDMYGNLQDAVDRIGAILLGSSYRPFELEHSCYPLAELGDFCAVSDRKGNSYGSIITDIEFNFKGKTIISCKSDNPMRNSSRYLTSETKAIAEANKLIRKEKTERQTAIDEMSKEIANSSGMYQTDITDEETGAVIRLLHNKPKLEDSAIQWKMTSDTISVSTDFGKTFNFALDASGTEIVKRLLVETITADAIRGGTLAIGGVNNQHGVIEMYDENGEWAGTWDNYGLGLIADYVYSSSGSLVGGGGVIVRNTNDRQSPNLAEAVLSSRVMYTASSNYSTFVGDLSMFGFPSQFGRYGIGIQTSGTTSALTNTYGLIPNLMVQNSASFGGGASFNGMIQCQGLMSMGMKYRAVNTEHFGTVGMNAYETSEPYFGDIGEGVTDETGVCDIYFDDVFCEVSDTTVNYQVFLQKYGKGDIWVEERTPHMFRVKGDANLSFGWEIKAIQRDYTNNRFNNLTDEVQSAETMDDIKLNEVKMR